MVCLNNNILQHNADGEKTISRVFLLQSVTSDMKSTPTTTSVSTYYLVSMAGSPLCASTPTPYSRFLPPIFMPVYALPVIHRWESPILHYHIIRVNYHYPFLGVIFGVIFMILLNKITIKNSQIVALFPLLW